MRSTPARPPSRRSLLTTLTAPLALLTAVLTASGAVAVPVTVTDGPEAAHRSVPLSPTADVAPRTLPGTQGTAATTSAAPVSAATLTLDEGVHVIGLRWDGPQPEAAELRVREPGAQWGDWSELDDAVATAPFAADATPDGAADGSTGASGAPVEDDQDAPRATTGDVIIGAAEVQVRLVGEVADASLEAWTTSRTPEDVAAVQALPITTEEIAIGTRADWGADESMPRASRPSDLVHDRPKLGVTIHHTAGTNAYAAADVPSIIRGIFYYHGQTLKWDDIGYAALVDKYGRVWEGRAGGVEENIQLAHAFGMNRDWQGIALLGNHETEQVWRTALDALSELTAWTLETHGVTAGTTVRYTNAYEGWTRTLPVVHAHRDVGLTLCPGYNMYALMDTLRSWVVTDQQESSDAVQRIGGRDRYAVAAALAQRAFLEGTRTAYLAAGTDGALADALAVGPVAAQRGAAVLLTRRDTLPETTLSALTSLGVREVTILGGTASVSTAVEQNLIGRGLTVTRLPGRDRYDVAASLSADAVRLGLAPRTVYLASGQVMTDALGGSAAAAHRGSTMLLTRAGSLPGATSRHLLELRPSEVVVLGGEGTVHPAVLEELQRLLPDAKVRRVAGRDRYETSALTASDTFTSARSAVVSSGTTYADAIAGSQLAARHGSPVLLVRPSCRPGTVERAYAGLGITLSRLAGGPDSLAWSAGHRTC